MPVSVSRKVEHVLRRDGLDLDVRIDPLVLTRKQVERYQLPRIPIKQTDRRKDHFEAMNGTGAVELDALEALHPGVLRRIVEDAIEVYRAPTRVARQEITAAAVEFGRVASRIRRDVLDQYADDIARLEADFEAMTSAIQSEQSALAELADEYESRCSEHVEAINQQVAAFYEQARPVWQAVADHLDERKPDPDEFGWPEVEAAAETDDPLFNSSRDYVTQIDRYKLHQGKPTCRRKNGGAP